MHRSPCTDADSAAACTQNTEGPLTICLAQPTHIAHEASRFILLVSPALTRVTLLARVALCLALAASCARKPTALPPLFDRPARKLDPPRPELMPAPGFRQVRSPVQVIGGKRTLFHIF